jgi:ABC-type amino acid transport system permease subunit
MVMFVHPNTETISLVRTLKKMLAASLLALTISSGISYADQFRDGVTALNKGDAATALQLLLPLAKGGIAAAQFQIGSM